MSHKYTVPLKKLIRDLDLKIVYYPQTDEEILVSHAELMRPGLAFTGFFEGFVPARINMIGRTELAYLETLSQEELRRSLEEFLSRCPKAVITTQEYSFRSLFMELAPRTTVHGVLMEIYGEGVLLTGDSGVGKSETALELLKRGHRLIADDAVEVRRVSNTTLVGSAPDNIRHYMELRGVGIINVSRLFGVGSVKNTANVNFVIQLEPYDRNKVYDRIGLEEETTDVLGMRVPAATIPVQTGRNLAVIIEVATMNYRQRAMGNNSARELMEHLGLTDDIE